MNNLNQYEDHQLIVLLKKEKPFCEQAFNVLYSRYSVKLHSYCLFISENYKDSEEIFQDTWLKFYNSAKASKDIDSVTSYLYKIARNLSIDKYRSNNFKKSRNIENFDIEQIANPLNLQSKLENEELISIISLAINSLSEIHKETFLLVWFSGLKYSEVAEIVGETIDCVKKRSYRAMDEIQAILQPIINEISK
jgi:RNA polymerase sigma-70 factor (ECF subfamily)